VQLHRSLVDAEMAHRAHSRGDIAVAGDEQNRQRVKSPSERRLQIESLHSAHLQISHHTARRNGFALPNKFGR
jgi:hypothetical protein